MNSISTASPENKKKKKICKIQLYCTVILLIVTVTFHTKPGLLIGRCITAVLTTVHAGDGGQLSISFCTEMYSGQQVGLSYFAMTI